MVATGVTAVAIALMPGIAAAEWPPEGDTRGGDPQTGGGHDKGTLTSLISFSGSTKGKGSPKGFTASNNWTPPACWYEPRSASQFAEYVEAFVAETVNYPGQAGHAKSAVGQFRTIYKDGKYKNYNLDQEGKGAFWVAVRNPDRLNDVASMGCSELPEWVPNGTPPPFQNSVTPEVLAHLAYNQIAITPTTVSLAPTPANNKVNLATWISHDKADFKPVSVTATLNAAGVNVTATTTARPVSLHIKPGTADAQVHPGSGECAINADGTIGAPFTEGSADKNPPCGLTYLRSSGNGTYALEASITWEVNWTSTTAPGGGLPPGTFAVVQNITVQEIQAVNR